MPGAGPCVELKIGFPESSLPAADSRMGGDVHGPPSLAPASPEDASDSFVSSNKFIPRNTTSRISPSQTSASSRSVRGNLLSSQAIRSFDLSSSSRCSGMSVIVAGRRPREIWSRTRSGHTTGRDERSSGTDHSPKFRPQTQDLFVAKLGTEFPRCHPELLLEDPCEHGRVRKPAGERHFPN